MHTQKPPVNVNTFKITKENHAQYRALADAARARNRPIRQQAELTARALLKQDHSSLVKASLSVQAKLLHELIVEQIVKLKAVCGTGSGKGCGQVQRLRELFAAERELLELHGELHREGANDSRVQEQVREMMREDPELVLDGVQTGVEKGLDEMINGG